jgi:hypothetical protein
VEEDIVFGAIEDNATITPFEVTLMHVPAKTSNKWQG